MKPVLFLSDADTDLEEIMDWYMNISEKIARRFTANLDKKLELVAALPDLFAADENGSRKMLLDDFSYAVVYKEYPDHVMVVSIAHAKRRSEFWVSRIT